MIRSTWLPYPASRANGHSTRTSRDLDAREGDLLLARGNGRAAAGDRRLDGGGAGQLVAGSVDPVH